MKQKCEEEVKIHNARKHWNKIRRNKRVFQMMYRIGEEHVMTLINERRNRQQIKEKQKNVNSSCLRLLESGLASKLIIPPNNYWNMVCNNIIVAIFLIYMCLLPLFVSYNSIMKNEDLFSLFIFDVIFIFDRFLDLFVGYYQEDGQLEKSLARVINSNMSMKIFFEIFMTFGPLMIARRNIESIVYVFFKLPRWLRLFELEQRIEEFVEYFRENKTLSEIKAIRKWL